MRGRRTARFLFAAFVTVALVTGGLTAPREPASAAVTPGSVAPSEDPFYTPPKVLPEHNGALIRSRPFTAYLSGIFLDGQVVPVPARGWQIMYRSTNAIGRPIAATGSVFVPYAPYPGARPLVAYAPGTVGPGDACTPSYGLATGSWYESALAAPLTTGYAVVVPDYEGMGIPRHSTYVTGWSEGRTTLDAARAAQRLPAAGLSSRTPTAIMGYSQGGGAAAWAAQLQPRYAPGLNLKGVVAGGVPGDLRITAEHLAGSSDIHLFAWALMGLHHAYGNLPWQSLLTPRGKRMLAKAENTCEAVPPPGTTDPNDGATFFKGVTVDDLFTTNPLRLRSWRRKLELNSAGALPPKVPVYQYGSPADTIVAYRAQRSTYFNWCLRGVNVQWHDTMPLDHVPAAIQQFPAALAWVGSRFAGQPSTSTC
jgi:hypothetical protein